MAGNISDYLENKILEHVMGKTTYTKPTATYLALYLVTPTDSTAGTEVANANGYVRQAITWGTASNGTISNSAQITFPAATGSPWGTVTALGVVDASVWGSGNILWYGPVSPNVTIAVADIYQISVGGLQLTLD